MKKGLFIFLILGLFGFVFLAQAFSVTPVKQVITLEQGASRVVKIKIRNTEKEITKYKTTILGVKQNEQGYPIYGLGIEEAEGWVRAEQEFIEILPGKEMEASFVINVPKESYPGSHYVGLGVEPILIGESKNFTGKLVSLLLVEVSGEVTENLAVLSWSGEKDLYVSLNQVKFNTVLKNNGNTELPLKGKLRVYNWLNKEVVESEVYLGGPLLAQNQRKSEVLLPVQKSWYLPGSYRAQLDLIYGRTNQKLSVQYSFWYLPLSWLIVLSIFLGLIFLATIRKIISKKRQTNYLN